MRRRSGMQRKINNDYVTKGIVWDKNTPSREIPDSLYLTEKPAFFGDNAWPWVTPDNPDEPDAALTKLKTDNSRIT